MDYWMVPLKTMNVIPRRIALNVEVIGDVRNAMVVVTWIAMCAMVMGNAGIVEAMVVHVAQNVVATEDVESVAELVRLFVGIVMEQEKRKIQWQAHTEQKNMSHVVHVMARDTHLANIAHQQG